MNSATDNPMVFTNPGRTISGGNFHGEYPAKAMDYLAIGIHEIANISEVQLYFILFIITVRELIFNCGIIEKDREISELSVEWITSFLVERGRTELRLHDDPRHCCCPRQ